MAYLFLAIASSFAISLLIKDNETRGVDTEVVLASNYLSAGAVGWLFVLVGGSGTAAGFDISRETLRLGLGGSLLWPGAFYLQMWGIRRYGVSLAGSVARLSLSIPVLFALLFLGERFTSTTVLGISGAFAAFLLLSPFTNHHTPTPTLDRTALWYFPTLLVVFGCVDLWANLYTVWAPGDERFLFMVIIFSGAGLLAWAAVLVRGRKVARSAVSRGLLLGIPNFFSTYFLMESLRTPALQGHSAIVYAVYSALGVVLAFLAGRIFWQEPLNARNRVGVVIAVAAVVLLNLR